MCVSSLLLGVSLFFLLALQAQAPSLLDIAFDDVANSASALPPADYLPALERQKELEAQLLKQQVRLLSCWNGCV